MTSSGRGSRKIQRIDFKKGYDDDETAEEYSYSFADNTVGDGASSNNSGNISSESRISNLQKQKRAALASKSNRRSSAANQGFYSAKELYDIPTADLLHIEENYLDGYYDPLINCDIDLRGGDENMSVNTSTMSTGRLDRLYAKGEEAMLRGIILSKNEKNKNNSGKESYDKLKRAQGLEEMINYAKQNMVELQSYDGFEPDALHSVGTRARGSQGSISEVGTKVEYNDPPFRMTWGRRIAIFLSQYRWYNPTSTSEEPHYEDEEAIKEALLKYGDTTGDLLEGWQFFEHNTLPRHMVPRPRQERLEKVNPGYIGEETQLYSVWKTPYEDLGDFGLAIGVYFHTALALAFITLIAGVMNIPNILYYWSSDYDASSIHNEQPFLLQGSAICGDSPWVPCPDCSISHWDNDGAKDRYAVGINTDLGTNVTFAMKNNCEGAVYSSFGVIVFVYIAIFYMSLEQEEQEIKFDEDLQSAPDYAIVIDNPPQIAQARDPDEWRNFLEKISGGHCTFVSISVDNRLFIEALIEKRRKERLLRKIFQNSRMDIEEIKVSVLNAPPSSFMDKITGKCPKAIWEDYLKNEKYLEMLASQTGKIASVFAIFETEETQRHVLEQLSVGGLNVALNWSRSLPDDHRFYGTILEVSEPDEPGSIRWLDLSAPEWKRKIGILISFTLTIGFIFLGAFLIFSQRKEGGGFVALCIAILNSITPAVCKFIVGYEIHPDEGEKSLSLYTKMTLFRWVNTALILSLATPFTHSLGMEETDLIPSIYKVFFAELFTAPSLNVLDISGHISRHFNAPRAETQEEVNACFLGTDYELADRYTTVTKLVFLCCFFSTLYPVGYFVCSAALFVTYYSDKFCLLRIWKPAPPLGNEIAEFSRNYFYILIIVVMVIASAYQFAGFPYDNLCNTNTPVSSDYIGNFTIYYGETFTTENSVNVSVTEEATNYIFCDMNKMWSMDATNFPPTSSLQGNDPTYQWMTETQKGIVDLIGFYGLGIILVGVSYRFISSLYQSIKGIFVGLYEPVGEVQGCNFCEVESASAYVPQVRLPDFNYPLLAANIENIPARMVGWQGQPGDHEFFSLLNHLPKSVSRDNNDILPIVKFYPPS